MGGSTIRGRVRVYVIGVVVLASGVGTAVFGRGDAQAASPRDTPSVTVGQERIHAADTIAISRAPRPADHHSRRNAPMRGVCNKMEARTVVL